MSDWRKTRAVAARTLPIESAMTWIDLLIIYLACGAPFGVYYFTQNRTTADPQRLWVKTLLNFLFWLPYAFSLLRRNNFLSVGKLSKESTQAANLQLIKKQLEKIFLTSRLEISVYEFREVLERYVGLTIANQTDAAEIAETKKEFFLVAENKNIELGAICLDRRNRKRLARHQTEARKDFLDIIARLSETDSDKINLKHWSINLALYLKDFEAQRKLELLFVDEAQTANHLNVEKMERILWKPAAPKPSPAEQVSYQLPIMKATLNLRRKD